MQAVLATFMEHDIAGWIPYEVYLDPCYARKRGDKASAFVEPPQALSGVPFRLYHLLSTFSYTHTRLIKTSSIPPR